VLRPRRLTNTLNIQLIADERELQISCNGIGKKKCYLKITYIVNVYPQAINRDCCDKNHEPGAQKHRDIQTISQAGGVNPAVNCLHNSSRPGKIAIYCKKGLAGYVLPEQIHNKINQFNGFD
jgi:hypothetical protein